MLDRCGFVDDDDAGSFQLLDYGSGIISSCFNDFYGFFDDDSGVSPVVWNFQGWEKSDVDSKLGYLSSR